MGRIWIPDPLNSRRRLMLHKLFLTVKLCKFLLQIFLRRFCYKKLYAGSQDLYLVFICWEDLSVVWSRKVPSLGQSQPTVRQSCAGWCEWPRQRSRTQWLEELGSSQARRLDFCSTRRFHDERRVIGTGDFKLMNFVTRSRRGRCSDCIC